MRSLKGILVWKLFLWGVSKHAEEKITEKIIIKIYDTYLDILFGYIRDDKGYHKSNISQHASAVISTPLGPFKGSIFAQSPPTK